MQEVIQDKKYLARVLISEIEGDKISKVSTIHFEKYQKPQKIISSEINDGFVPDIMVDKGKGRKDLYEIELSEKFNPIKWNLFSRFAVINKGEFFIVLPEQYMSKAKTEIKTQKLKNIHLLYFKEKN